jgi:hypothetical protein
MEGGNAGSISPAPFRAQLEIRQLDSVTLAPISSYSSPTESVPADGPFKLSPAWFNTDNDEELEEVFQWTRICIDKDNQIIRRSGAYTTSKTSNPTGLILERQQFMTFAQDADYKRLPDLGPDEIEIHRICVKGNVVDEVQNLIPVTVTGCALSMTGLTYSIAAGTVDRGDIETIKLGADGEPFCKRKDAFTYALKFTLPLGCYQVRIRRTNSSLNEQRTPANNKKQVFHDAYFLTLTGYENRRPITPPKPLAMTAIRLKATNQFNGNAAGIAGTAISIAKDWNRTTLTWVERPTRNPASLLRHILQHPANAQRVPDSQIDLDALVDWHNFCRTNQFMFDAVISQQRSLLDVMRDVCAAGRASPTIRDGKWSVVIDRPRTVIAQHFTPHNSWGFEATRALPNLPHAFRVQFANSERAYQPDEMIVYNDGYSASNATFFEGLELPGVTTKAAIYKHARFHLAQLKLRPEVYTINADIEHLICTRGDLVRVTHDVPLWGIGSGRINDRVSGTVLELDEPVPMDAGVQYTIRIRLESGSSITRTVEAATTDGYYSTITLTSSVTTTQGKAGNLFMFGSLSAESVELIVLAIEPAENMTARLTLVDYSPDIYDSDTGPIPDFDSQITLPVKLQQETIKDRPRITGIVSNESVLVVLAPGSYQVRLRGRPLDLTFREFELLKALASAPNRVFTRDLLLQEVWGYDYFGGSRTVDVHVRRVRAKLGPEYESMIATVRGVGYKLVPPGQRDPDDVG